MSLRVQREITVSTIIALFLVLPGALAPARAMTFEFEPIVGTISGADFFVAPVALQESSNLRVTLTDLAEPVRFQQLAFGWFQEADGQPVPGASLGSPGILDFDLDPGNYLAIVGGIADANVDIGTFGLEISNLPVPAAVWLFGSSLGLLALRQRRNG